MNPKKKLVTAAAVAAGVGIGTIAGAMFGTPTISGALTSSASASAPFAQGGERREAVLETSAEAIGVTVEELRTALQDGQTIAEVAAANDVDAQVVIDALVDAASARIDEAVADGELTAEEGEERKANLDERMTALVNGERPPHGPGGPGHRRRGQHLEPAAEAIGVTVEELRTALRDGQTIAEVAAANDVDVQVVIDALVAEATERITLFVNGE